MSHKKTERINLRVSENAKIELNNRAEAANLSLSDFVVKSGTGVKISAPRSKYDQEGNNQISRVGNLLNQLTTKANSGVDVDSNALFAIADELKQLRKSGVRASSIYKMENTYFLISGCITIPFNKAYIYPTYICLDTVPSSRISLDEIQLFREFDVPMEAGNDS